MATAKGNTERVVLGGCKHYIAEFVEGTKLTDLKTYCVEDNIIGWTQGGTTLRYTPETKTIEDDVGMVHRTFFTKANAELLTGLLTFDLNSISNILSTGKFTAGEPGGVNRLELSGGKTELKRYIIVAEHESDDGHNLRVGMVAANTAALELIFNKENETVPNITFTAASNGVDDTIVVLEEDVPQEA